MKKEEYINYQIKRIKRLKEIRATGRIPVERTHIYEHPKALNQG